MRFAKNEGSLGVLNLRSKEWPVLGLIIEFHCGWDSHRRYLAVEKSSLTMTPMAEKMRIRCFAWNTLRIRILTARVRIFMSMPIVMNSRISWALLPKFDTAWQKKFARS